MDRRNFLRGATALSAFQLMYFDMCGPVHDILPQPPAPNQSTAHVNMEQLYQSAMQQNCPEWCWAASISMMFTFYGHPVPQEVIVAQTYGGPFCLPSGSTTTIGRTMSRPWVDINGKAFTSQVVSAYDFYNGINTFTNASIVAALNGNNPLLYCNTHHAMVLYNVVYSGPATSPTVVTEVDVVDPWPLSPRLHQLTPSEMIPAHLGGEMTFLAQIKIT